MWLENNKKSLRNEIRSTKQKIALTTRKKIIKITQKHTSKREKKINYGESIIILYFMRRHGGYFVFYSLFFRPFYLDCFDWNSRFRQCLSSIVVPHCLSLSLSLSVTFTLAAFHSFDQSNETFCSSYLALKLFVCVCVCTLWTTSLAHR